jgi:hypothetical protein
LYLNYWFWPIFQNWYLLPYFWHFGVYHESVQDDLDRHQRVALVGILGLLRVKRATTSVYATDA